MTRQSLLNASRQRLRKTAKGPRLSDTAITTLARWKDWTVQERLMELYGAKDFDDKTTRTAIIGYMIASTKDVPRETGELIPQHAADGAKYLNQLRDKDAKLVNDTERLFLIQ